MGEESPPPRKFWPSACLQSARGATKRHFYCWGLQAIGSASVRNPAHTHTNINTFSVRPIATLFGTRSSLGGRGELISRERNKKLWKNMSKELKKEQLYKSHINVTTRWSWSLSWARNDYSLIEGWLTIHYRGVIGQPFCFLWDHEMHCS